MPPELRAANAPYVGALWWWCIDTSEITALPRDRKATNSDGYTYQAAVSISDYDTLSHRC